MSKNYATIDAIMSTDSQYEQASVNIKQKLEQVWAKVKEYAEQSYNYVAGLFTVVGAMEAFKSIPNWVIYFVGFMGLWFFSAAKIMKDKRAMRAGLVGAALYGIFCMIVCLSMGWGLFLATAVSIVAVVYMFVLAMIVLFIATLGVDLVMFGKDHVNTIKAIVMAKAFF